MQVPSTDHESLGRWGRATFSFLFIDLEAVRGLGQKPHSGGLNTHSLPTVSSTSGACLRPLCVSCGTRENRRVLDQLIVHGLLRARTLTVGVKVQSLARGGHKAFTGSLCSSYLQSIIAKQAWVAV